MSNNPLKAAACWLDVRMRKTHFHRFLLGELNKPVSLASVAALADTPETAAELYIASALVVDMDSPSERNYLDELATAMKIDSAMIRHLEAPLRG